MRLVETDAAGLDRLLRGRAPAPGLVLAPGGVAPAEALRTLRGALEAGARVWLAVEAGEVVGLCGTKSAPIGGTVEIGYAVAPSRRRRGHAGAAVAALLAALGAEGVARAAAQTEAGNLASERVLTRAGFARAGLRAAPEGPATLWWRALAPDGANAARPR